MYDIAKLKNISIITTLELANSFILNISQNTGYSIATLVIGSPIKYPFEFSSMWYKVL